ncbi:MAG TPA: excinuclease ABC subunit UvrC [Alphaproteobacteria bacterium]|nr:excinuclease ABC subunit UvrC [Alphaproteobacteria bacterium]
MKTNESNAPLATDEPKLTESLKRGLNIIGDFVKTLTKNPGVYRMLDRQETVLYIGKAKHLKNRVTSYTHILKLPTRLKRMVSETYRMEVVCTHTETEALLLESNLIKKLQPRYNILLKDDKSFPYILIETNHDFPRISKHRGPQTKKGLYFGPFANVEAVDETLILLQKIFMLRNCTNTYYQARKRPCLQYDIKRCTAPCVHKVLKQDYAEQLNEAADFLNGKNDQVQQVLADRMQLFSQELAFEKAAQIRDRLKLLTHIQSKQRINVAGIKDADILAIERLGSLTCVQVFFFRNSSNYGTESFFVTHAQDHDLEETLCAFIMQFYQEREPSPLLLLSHPLKDPLVLEALKELHSKKIIIEIPKLGIKKDLIEHALSNAKEALKRRFSQTAETKELIKTLGQAFDITAPIERIEIYDNSHLQGTNPYGVMVVATPEGLQKKLYRKFAIKDANGLGDDYAMMKEVMTRRFKRVEEENWNVPTLMLIDGGAGQLSVVEEVLKELCIEGVRAVGIAKGPERNAGRERFFITGKEPFSLEPKSSALYFLQRLRDEAHRFAIGTHRAKREKDLSKSLLDDIPGIGGARKKSLLRHFGSAQVVAKSALSDLMIVPGISKSVAKSIYDYFHEK